MEKSQIVFFVCFASLLLILLLGFLFFVLFWQRRKSNKFISERETMKALFNEQLLKSQLEMQEQTFNTISMEIHDNVGQTLSLLNVQLNIIDQKEILDRILISEAKESARKAMNDLRDIAKSLNTERIQQSTLSEMAAHELQRINLTGLMNIILRNEGEEQLVQAEKKLIVFRILQECLQNIIKHSNAKEVEVCFFYGDDHLKITIKDNGQGFEKSLVMNNELKGLGLQNIVKRAEIINGKAEIESATNQGTIITITTPYV